MKTPDEIKKGLEYLHIKDIAQKLEAWEEGVAYEYVEDIAADAIALIQQLEAQVPSWISVEERLPEERLCVSVYIQEDGGAYWIETAFRRNGKWRIQGEYVIDRNITHWMPLPQPPEMKEEIP